MKILLVDDNESITKMMSKFLIKKGYDIIVSNDGRNALTLINNQKFDKILLDLSMPEFTGRDLIDALEKDGRLHQNNIILFTASAASDDELNKLMQRGVKGCLRKPVDLDLLLSVVNS
jgi:CheY-like chemotaxis protein